jgi:hypothetical protein
MFANSNADIFNFYFTVIPSTLGLTSIKKKEKKKKSQGLMSNVTPTMRQELKVFTITHSLAKHVKKHALVDVNVGEAHVASLAVSLASFRGKWQVLNVSEGYIFKD